MRVYIAGPITGYDLDERVEYFRERKRILTERGHDPVNPLDLHPLEVTWKQALSEDLVGLLPCDAIELNPGWEKSTGALLELLVSRLFGKIIMDTEGEPVAEIDMREALHAFVEKNFVSGDSILQEAQRLVWGHRQNDYDHPLPNFLRIAAGWNVILEKKLTAPIDAVEVGLMNVWQKITREVHKPKRDNRVDMAGYAATVQRIYDRREGEAGAGRYSGTAADRRPGPQTGGPPDREDRPQAHSQGDGGDSDKRDTPRLGDQQGPSGIRSPRGD